MLHVYGRSVSRLEFYSTSAQIESLFMRLLGNFHQALDKYRQTHEKFPESKEVLQYLVRLCSDMNMDKGPGFKFEHFRFEHFQFDKIKK